jgi:hypothetical protein
MKRKTHVRHLRKHRKESAEQVQGKEFFDGDKILNGIDNTTVPIQGREERKQNVVDSLDRICPS